MDSTERFIFLLRKFRLGSASREELDELFKLSSQLDHENQLEELWHSGSGALYFDEAEAEQMLRSVLNADRSEPEADIFKTAEMEGPAGPVLYGKKNKPSHSRRRKKYLLVAASIIVLVLVTTLYFMHEQEQQEIAFVRQQQNKWKTDIPAPLNAKAILTLHDGSTIIISDSANGLLALNGNYDEISIENGAIIHNAPGSNSDIIHFNTLTVPRGSEIMSVRLHDGTRVWLNAESSLRYPTRFAGKERKVEVTGEAFFEVTKRARMPFVVSKGDLAIRVLGTSFNVNAYDNENSSDITLIEGSVEAVKGRTAAILKPGQQARVKNNGDIHLVNNADVEAATAWKNGYFQFNGTSLESVMRQISRWYDVQFEFEGKIEDRFFVGQMDRTKSLRTVLKILEESDVHFRVQGKKVIVMP